MGNEFQIEKVIFTSINLIDNILNLNKGIFRYLYYSFSKD